MIAIAFLYCGTAGEVGGADFLNRSELEGGVSDNGAVTLSWAGEGTQFELEQGSRKDFIEPLTRYRGPDLGSVITGLAEGTHYFRIRNSPSGEWSRPLAVEVKFFPKFKLFLILGIGGVVVISTIGTIVLGHFRTRGEEA